MQIKIKIFKKYKLEDVAEAHKDLESRKIIGPAVIIPWWKNSKYLLNLLD